MSDNRPARPRRTAPLAALLLLALVGCKSGADAPPADGSPKLTPVKVQLNWVPEPEFGGLYAAVEKGLYRNAGLDVEIIKGSAGVPSAQLAASGKVEFAVVTATEVIKLRARGAELVALYAQFRLSPRGFVVHAASPHATLEALWKSEATVVIEPGASYARWLDARFGGQKLQRVPASGSLAGFIADPRLGQAVYVFAEPVELEQRDVPVRILDVADTGFNPYEAVLATRRPYLEANRATVDAFVEATRRGWTAYLADPGPINAVMAELNPAMSKTAMDTSTRLAERYVRGTDPGPLGAMTTARWATLVDQLVQLGDVEANAAPPPDSLYLAQ